MKLNSRRALQIILASVLLLMGCDVTKFAAPQQNSNAESGRGPFDGGSNGRGGCH